MQKKLALALLATVFSLLALSALPTFAAVNSINVNPAVVSKGGTVTITLTTGLKATGTVSVKDPNGNVWTSSKPVDIPMGGGSQQWIYPDDFPGATTDTMGSYDASAVVTMPIGKLTWNTTFQVEFFVIPELPFGIIAATVAGFAAFGAMKFKHKKPI